MDCNETKRLLDAYVDGELELTPELDMEAHLAACSTCKKAAEAAINFRFSIRVNMPVYKTPPELKRKIRATLRKESGSWLERVFQFWRHLAGTAGGLGFGFSFSLAWVVGFSHKKRRIIDEGNFSHLFSLPPLHLFVRTPSSHTPPQP